MRAKVLNCLDKNVDKHLNNVKAVNDWFKKNYNNNNNTIDDDLTEPLSPTVVVASTDEYQQQGSINTENENKIENSENLVQDGKNDDSNENN
jgi:hypothetical protein